MISINREKYLQSLDKLILNKFGVETPVYPDINVKDTYIEFPMFISYINLDKYFKKEVWINLPIGISYSLTQAFEVSKNEDDFKNYFLGCLFKLDTQPINFNIYAEAFYKNIIVACIQNDRILLNNEKHLKERLDFLNKHEDLITSDIYIKERESNEEINNC